MDTTHSKVLFVDDQRRPPFEAKFAAGNMGAVSFLEEVAELPEDERQLDQIWLDFNLALGATTEETANWLVANATGDRPIRIGTILIHSNDIRGRRTLHAILDPHFNCVDADLGHVETL